jgi:hypothetical protein
MIAMHHLKRHPSDVEERVGIFLFLLKWGQDKVWYYMEKVQALKAQKNDWHPFKEWSSHLNFDFESQDILPISRHHNLPKS